MEEDEFGEMVQRSQPKLSPDTGWALRKSEADAAGLCETVRHFLRNAEDFVMSMGSAMDSEDTEASQERSAAPQSDSDTTTENFEVQSGESKLA